MKTYYKQSDIKYKINFPTDHYVVINLRQGGKVIGTKETKGAGGNNPVWNAPFLFDLPTGDISQMPLILEFIVMQVGALTGCMDEWMNEWSEWIGPISRPQETWSSNQLEY